MVDRVTRKDLQFRKHLNDLAGWLADYRNGMSSADWASILTMTYKPKVYGPYMTGVILDYSEKFKAETSQVPSTSCSKRVLEELSGTNAFQEVEDALEASCVNPIQARFKSSNLVDSLLAGQIDSTRIIDTVVDEFLSRPIKWSIRVALLGAMLKTSRKLELGSLTVRHPNSEDFPHPISIVQAEGTARPIGWPPKASVMLPVSMYLTWAQECMPRGSTASDSIVEEIIAKTRELRLLKPSRFSVTGWDAWSDGITEKIHLQAHMTPQRDPLDRNYPDEMYSPIRFTKEDARRYLDLRQKALSKLTSDHPVSKRIDRALWALEEISRHSAVEGVLFAVIGLESLFLANEQELRVKLAMRVAGWLKYLGKDPTEVYRDVWSAYGIRNKFVHGETISEERVTTARSSLSRLIDYLRRSILAWLQIECASKKEADSFLELLEKVHLSPKSQWATEIERKLDGAIV